VEDLSIKEALEGYIPENNRSQLLTKGSNDIILDAYNANPSSMTVAIENFIQIQGLNKIMILGDMFELGSEEKRASANCRLLLKVKSVQCFYRYDVFIQVGSVIHNFNFMNHLILLVYLGA
jgi:UDP-N-acetylmuramoyl-tripeptide--D-alanyl-D-alanine ligase